MLKNIVITLLQPFRGPVTWACQRGLLTSKVHRILPARWVLQPFTIYGSGWKCRWFPTEADAVAHKIFWSGLRDWEKETAPVILDNIRRSHCFIDIGANTGFYTVAGAAANPNVRVVAVEPVPGNCAALRRNVAENGLASRVTVLNMALGESNGTVSFHQAEDATMGSLATGGYQGQRGKIIQVECRTLDLIVEELAIKPDFLKIDVEGFEHAVLSGAGGVLDRFRPRIVLEANPGDRGDHVTAILSQHGYTFGIITDKGVEMRPEIIAEDAYRNWLCLPIQK